MLPKDHKSMNRPIVKKQSPTLLVKKAEIELWFAAILVNQKFTKRYEQIPTPSHKLLLFNDKYVKIIIKYFIVFYIAYFHAYMILQYLLI